MELKRRKFQGVINILSFNRHFYIYGLLILAIIIISHLFLQWSNMLFYIILIGFSYGLVMPLVVSAYVYDISGYYNFNWLENLNLNASQPLNIVNINAGFDETSFILKAKLPKSNLRVFDFYNEQNHTEPAIVRARKVSLVYPNTKKINSNNIPLPDKTVDIVFLLSAAHEIRSFDEKILFIKECKRICKPNGKIIMVEHLRDFSNFLAFSIGFTHFFSKCTWQKAFKSAEFPILNETKFTPFMSIFNT